MLSFLQKSKPQIILVTLLLLGTLFVAKVHHAQAAVRTWDGGGSDGTCGGIAGDGNKWSCALNWSSDTLPGSNDIATFDATSTKNATVDASFSGSVSGVDINSGYTGTITQSRSLTVGGANFDQAAGTWTGGSQTLDINSGSFILSGGTHNATTGTWAVEKDLTQSGGTLNGGSSTVTFDDNGNNGINTTLTCTGTFSPTVAVNKTGNSIFTLASGCTITLGSFLSRGSAVFNGTASGSTMTVWRDLTIGASGSLTMSGAVTLDDGGNNTVDSTLTCTGTLSPTIAISKTGNSIFTLASGCSITLGSFLSRGSVVINGTASGSTMTVWRDLTIAASGSLTMSGAVTLDDGGNSTVDSTLTCTGTFSPTVTINKTNNSNFTLVSGCSITMNASLTRGSAVFNGTASGTTMTVWRDLTIGASGSLTMSGAVTFDDGGNGGVNSTLTCTGTFSSTAVNKTNNSNFTLVSGCTATFGAFLDQGSVTIAGTATTSDMTIGRDLTITGTLSSSGTITWATNVDAVLTCSTFSIPSIFTKGNDADFTIAAGCVATFNGLSMPAIKYLRVNGTLNNTGSTFDIDGGSCCSTGGVIVGASGTVTYSGTNISIERQLTQGGTWNLSGKTITFDGSNGGDDTIVTCTGSLGGTIVIAKNQDDSSFTLASGCTITVSSISGRMKDLIINGTMNHTGSTFDVNSGACCSTGGLYINASGTVTYSGTDITIERDFTQNGTFNLAGKTITFDGSDSADNSTMTCSGSLGGTVVIAKATNDGSFTLAAGCTITVNSISGAIKDLIINGTMNHTGTTFDVNGGACCSTGGLYVNPGGTITYSGTAISIERDFTQNGTFDLTGKTITIDGSDSADNTTFTCSGSLGGTVVIAKGTNDGSFTLVSGCTITVSSISGFIKDININGTMNHTGTTFDVNGDACCTTGGLFVNSGGTVTFAGTNISIERYFTQNGTFDLTGKTITFDSNEGGDNTLLTCGAGVTLGSVIINKVSGGNVTANSNCTFTGDLTRTLGVVANPGSSRTWFLNGALAISGASAFGGSNLTVELNGTGSLSVSNAAGATFSSPFRVNKTAGTALLTTDFTVSSAACTVAQGIFDLNAKAFTCATGFTVQNTGTLQLVGSETPTTPTLNTGSTVLYRGDGDGLADTYTINNWTYSNLTSAMTDSADTLGVTSSNTLDTSFENYWKFDDGSGTTAADSSGNSHPGTLTNMEAGDWDTGNLPPVLFSDPYSLVFDDGASNEFVIATDAPDPTAYTLSAWVRPTDVSDVTIIVRSDGSGPTSSASHRLYIDSSGHFVHHTYDGSGRFVTGTTVAVPGNWYHVVGTASNGGTMRLYVNGVEEGTPVSGIGTLWTGGDRYYIGSNSFGSIGYFGGNIDDVRVYNRVLSQAEITSLAAGNNNNSTSLATVNVNGNFTLSGGTFSAPATLNVGGNFNRSGGTFTHNSGTVVLNGGDQTITGSTIFNNLTKNVTAAHTLTFPAGGTQTVGGALTLTGQSGNLLSLRSSASPTQWNISPTGSRTLSYIDVQDSNNISGTAIPTLGFNMVDSGNNTGWLFNHAPSAPSNLGPLSLVNGSWTNDNTPTLTFDLADSDVGDTVQYQIQIDDTSNFSSPVVDYTSSLAAPGSYSFTVGQALSGGAYAVGSVGQTLTDASGYYWRVKAIDNSVSSSANTTANGGAIAFKLDTVAPTAGTLAFSAISGTSITVTDNGASDSGSGLAASPYTFTNTNSSQTSGAQASSAWVNSGLTSNASYNYSVQVADLAGNTATATGSSQTQGGGGGAPPGTFNPPTPPPGGFRIFINSDAASTTTANVTVTLFGGPDTARMSISNDPNFLGAIQENYTSLKAWNLCGTPQVPNPPSCPLGTYTVYAKFFTATGQPSSGVSDTINLVAQNTPPPPQPTPPPTPTPPPPNPPPTPSPTPPPSQCTLTKDQVNANFKAAMQKAKADYEAIVQPALQQKQDKIITAQRYQDIHQQQSDIWNAAKAKARADRKLALSKVCTVIPPEPPIPIPTPPPLPPSQPPVTPPTQTPPPPSNVPPVNQPPVTPPGGTTTPPSNQPPSNNPPGNTPGNIPGNEEDNGQSIWQRIVSAAKSGANKVAEVTNSITDRAQDIANGTLATVPASSETISAFNKIAAVAAIPFTTLASYASTVALTTGGIAFDDLWLLFYRWLLGLATFIGLRKKRKYWGTVFDSVSKQPLDPAIVTLYDARTGAKVEQAITDLLGRFGFLVIPGTYIIKAEKTHYAFPSHKIEGNSDGIFDNIYHGQAITIATPSDVVSPNIPMDPLAFDWNQQDKQRIVKFHPLRERFLNPIATSLFILGFILALFVVASNPSTGNFVIMAAYIAVMFVRLVRPPKRLWGKLYAPDNIKVSGLMLQLTPIGLDGVIMGRAQTGPDGKFFLKAPSHGTYNLVIKDPTGAVIKKLTVGTNPEGILTQAIDI